MLASGGSRRAQYRLRAGLRLMKTGHLPSLLVTIIPQFVCHSSILAWGDLTFLSRVWYDDRHDEWHDEDARFGEGEAIARVA
jgi:hypothetical protein